MRRGALDALWCRKQASRLVRSNGLTWAELVIPLKVAQVAPPSGPDPRRRSDLGSNLALCRRHLGPSTAQPQKLAEIAASLRARGFV